MRSPWPIIVIIVSYIIFVTKFGPSLMKNRKPMNINGIMLVYNLYQCVSNGYMFMQIFVVKGALKFSIDHACHPLERNRNPYWHVVAHSTHLFILSKIMDLFDTVFFILKKKQTHVTFLHVYHHVNMVISSWVVCKYFPDEQFFVAGLLNSFVHCVMYGYYFLAALGPRVRKYLWWKIYVTRLQMVIISFSRRICVFKYFVDTVRAHRGTRWLVNFEQMSHTRLRIRISSHSNYDVSILIY
ncbi:hypothetical protein PGB90_004490 [Kerria lacca]